MKEIKNKNELINFLSYVAFVLIALLEVLNNVDIFSETAMNVLNTVKNLSIIFVIGVNAFRFANTKSKVWKIIYWVAFAIFVCAIVFIWVKF